MSGRRSNRRLLGAVMGVLLLAAAGLVLRDVLGPPETPPSVSWPVATPESVGLDGPALEALADDLSDRSTKALVVARHGRLVFEWYGPEFDADRRHYAASMVKGTAAAPALVAAAQQELLSLDEPAAKWIPEWATDPERMSIRLRHLAFHSSGLDDVDFDAGQAGELSGWKQRYYDRPDQRYHLAIDSAALHFPPGTGYAYSGVGYYVLSYIVTRSLQDGPVEDIPSLLDERVYGPIGLPPETWEIGYGRIDVVDGLPLAHFGSGGQITARAAARIGQLFLQRGCWDGEQVLDADLVDTMLGRGAITPVPPGDATESIPISPGGWWPTPTSGGGWWIDEEGVWPPAARDAAAALGYGHQIVWIDPGLDLVVVRLGEDLTSRREPFGDALTRYFVEPLYRVVAQAASLERGSPDVTRSRRNAGVVSVSCDS